MHAGWELIVAGEDNAFHGEFGSFVLQLFSACGDFGCGTLHGGQFDESALVEVDEAALILRSSRSSSAVRSSSPGIGVRRVTACSPANRRSGRVTAVRIWSNTKASSASARTSRSGQRRGSPPARMGSWLRQ